MFSLLGLGNVEAGFERLDICQCVARFLDDEKGASNLREECGGVQAVRRIDRTANSGSVRVALGSDISGGRGPVLITRQSTTSPRL